MPYAHKLAVLEDTPHVKTVYCVICGHEDNLSGPCTGEPKMTAKDDANFAEIFSAPIPEPKKNKNFVSGLA